VRDGALSRHAAASAGLLLLVCAVAACKDSTSPREPRAIVQGTVRDVQANTRLFFYDDQLNQLGPLGVQVRSDGSYGPLAFEVGSFFGAGTATGFTTGLFIPITVGSESDSLTVDFDLNAITVPLRVGNTWTYQEQLGGASGPMRTVEVVITAEQPAEEGSDVFTVEERTGASTAGPADTTVYYLAQAIGGIRKSADPTVDASDELLLRLPAALGTTWSTVDFATGAMLQKRLKAISCGSSGCTETNDFTIAQEPTGTFMSVSEIHTLDNQAFVTVFSDIGIVGSFVQDTGSGAFISERKLTGFSTLDASPGP
jgi:hypothetical protein